MPSLTDSFILSLLCTHGVSSAISANDVATKLHYLAADAYTLANELHGSAFDADPLPLLRDAVQVMQTFNFDLCIGRWPGAIDWTAAVTNTHLISSLELWAESTPSNSQLSHLSMDWNNQNSRYFSHTVGFYYSENVDDIARQAYDDMLWVVLEWLDAVRMIRSHLKIDRAEQQSWHGSQYVDAFAQRAREFYELARYGWDTKLCDGGMIWNPRLLPYKNAITNELYIAASIGMYLHHPGDNISCSFTVGASSPPARNPSYLYAAIEAYDWFKRINLINHQGLIVDGYHIEGWEDHDHPGTRKCDQRNEMVYTYNQGVLLSGLRGLWESTKNRNYLDDGHELVSNTIAATGWRLDHVTTINSCKWAGLGRGGVLEEYCDAPGSCSQDGQTFKGIFFHHLSHFCSPLDGTFAPAKNHAQSEETGQWHLRRCKKYAAWVTHNAQAALSSRDVNRRFGTWWRANSTCDSEAPLPAGAIDYRNPSSYAVGKDPWISNAKHDLGNNQPLEQLGPYRSLNNDVHAQRDPNDRGRGRTVETQGGGVAVLSAWLRFSRMS